MNADLRSPRDLGEILAYTWRIYRSAFVTLFGIAMIVAPLGMLQAVIFRGIESENARIAVSYAFFLPAIIVSAIAEAALVVAVHDFTGNTAPDAGRSVDLVFERIVGVIGSVLMYILFVFAALFLSWPIMAIWWFVNRKATIDGRRDWWLVLIPFALPLYLALRWAFVLQAVMIENRRFWRAFDTSAEAIRGAWWRAFSTFLCVLLITIVPGALGGLSSSGPAYVEAIVTGAVGALVLPFIVTAQTLLYYDLTSRKGAANVIAA